MPLPGGTRPRSEVRGAGGGPKWTAFKPSTSHRGPSGPGPHDSERRLTREGPFARSDSTSDSPKLATVEACPGLRARGSVRSRQVHEGACGRVRHQPSDGVLPPSSSRSSPPSGRTQRRPGGRGGLPLRGRLVFGKACRTVRRQRRHRPAGIAASHGRDSSSAWRASAEGTDGPRATPTSFGGVTKRPRFRSRRAAV
jgi:hypothetical protein